MSDWTYIQGSVCLEASPYRIKKNKCGLYKIDKKEHDVRFYENRHLPFGKEQISFGFPELRKEKNRDGELTGAHLDYRIYLTSYPIIKEAVDKCIQDMPQGELGLFYSLIKSPGYRGSSSCCESKQIEDLFYEHLKEVNKEHIWSTITRKELDKYFMSKISWIEHNTESILTIHDAVRYCTADQMYNSLISFFWSLAKAGISFEDGILAFNDYYNHYTMRFDNDKITVEIKDDDGNTSTEYWQVFCKNHFIRDVEYELKKVDNFKKFTEYFDCTESDKEIEEYKAKYEPEVEENENSK